MVIRLAQAKDAWRIATIHIDAWRVAYRGIVPDEYLDGLSVEQRFAFWTKNLESGPALTWIAEQDGAVLGWISAAGSRDADAKPSTGEIWAVYIAPAHWRKGIGRALCAVAEQELRKRGFTEVTLWVLKDNERALAFYSSNGFIRDACDDRTVQPGGKDLPEVRMKKQFPR